MSFDEYALGKDGTLQLEPSSLPWPRKEWGIKYVWNGNFFRLVAKIGRFTMGSVGCGGRSARITCA